jgi:hypothetical protein
VYCEVRKANTIKGGNAIQAAGVWRIPEEEQFTASQILTPSTLAQGGPRIPATAAQTA